MDVKMMVNVSKTIPPVHKHRCVFVELVSMEDDVNSVWMDLAYHSMPSSLIIFDLISPFHNNLVLFKSVWSPQWSSLWLDWSTDFCRWSLSRTRSHEKWVVGIICWVHRSRLFWQWSSSPWSSGSCSPFRWDPSPIDLSFMLNVFRWISFFECVWAWISGWMLVWLWNEQWPCWREHDSTNGKAKKKRSMLLWSCCWWLSWPLFMIPSIGDWSMTTAMMVKTRAPGVLFLIHPGCESMTLVWIWSIFHCHVRSTWSLQRSSSGEVRDSKRPYIWIFPSNRCWVSNFSVISICWSPHCCSLSSHYLGWSSRSFPAVWSLVVIRGFISWVIWSHLFHRC